MHIRSARVTNAFALVATVWLLGVALIAHHNPFDRWQQRFTPQPISPAKG